MARNRRHRVIDDSLQRLELPRLLEVVAGYAYTRPGKEAVLALLPKPEIETLVALHEEVEEVRVLLEHRFPFRLEGLEDVRELLATSGPVATRSLRPEELARFRRLLDANRALGSALRDRSEELPRLAARGEVLRDLSDLREALERSIDPRGEEVLSTASTDLASLRRKAEEKERWLRNWMEKRRDTSTLKGVLQDNVVSVRHGRFVFGVRAESRSRVPGVVHGESGSGATLFIEPQDIVRHGDELEDLRLRARREEARILAELTQAVRERREPILRIREEIIAIDSAVARARFGLAFGAIAPEFTGDRLYRLVAARHPLLMWRDRDPSVGIHDLGLETLREGIVPLSLELSRNRYQMVVTGPNTGGKTVVLKVAGLLTLMAYCGIPVTAEKGTEIPMFDSILADIGDEQSLEQDLSTFSSHMTITAEILGSVSSRSLVLIDELGAGTDPLEGAALGEAILERLYQRGAFSLVTTHIGRLKEFAFRRRKCQNASMEFDPRRLGPTYRLIEGIPGRSNALFIAQTIGLPQEVLDYAEGVLQGEERVDGEILEGMERTRRDLERKRSEMEKHKQQARQLENEAEDRVKELESLRLAVEHEAEQSEEKRVEALVGGLRQAVRALGDPPQDKRAPYERLEVLLQEAERSTPLSQRRLECANSLKKGDAVFIPRFRQICEVKQISKGKELLTVSLNGISTQVSFSEISWILPPPGFELRWY